jgi:hypothetical protein
MHCNDRLDDTSPLLERTLFYPGHLHALHEIRCAANVLHIIMLLEMSDFAEIHDCATLVGTH